MKALPAAVVLLALLPCCRDSEEQFCVQDWPTAARPPSRKAALNVEAGKIRWSKKLLSFGSVGFGWSEGGVVLAGGRIACSFGTRIVILEKDGQLVSSEAYGGRLSLSRPTADREENLYFASMLSAYSVDRNGKIRWTRPYAVPAVDPEGLHRGGVPPDTFALDPDGTLYGGAADGQVHAIRAADGQVLWSVKAGRTPVTSRLEFAWAAAGAGSALIVKDGIRGTWVFDAKTGARKKQIVTKQGYPLLPGEGGMVLGHSWGFLSAFFSFDNCWNQRLELPATRRNRYVSVTSADDDQGLEVTWSYGTERESDDEMYLWAPDGKKVLGPKPGDGRPLAVGADGTIYTTSCISLRRAPEYYTASISAFSPDLELLWRLDLGNLCTVGSAALDEDGVLYVVRQLGRDHVTSELVAIQTASPGLADSSWPSWRHDNQGTSWLVSRP